MRRTRIDLWLCVVLAIIALASVSGCTESGGAVRVALVALKVFAGLVVAVLVFLPLMAALTTLRAGIRRLLAGRRTDRDSS